MTFRFIAQNAGEWPVAWMCDAPGVSESGYPARASRTPPAGDERRGELGAAVEVIHAEVEGRRHSSLGFLSPAEYERTHNPKRP